MTIQTLERYYPNTESLNIRAIFVVSKYFQNFVVCLERI